MKVDKYSRRVRVVAAAIITGAAVLAGSGISGATPVSPIGGTGSADFPSLPITGSAYTSSAFGNGSIAGFVRQELRRLPH
ncbi:hypothetical protein [Nocardia nova]|uniref:hypothetical protein n=1 Tax=Nocardia nova TaxID=37330 RepID=UPI0011DD3833|nr:hypothetical protein [Nocardia nova]